MKKRTGNNDMEGSQLQRSLFLAVHNFSITLELKREWFTTKLRLVQEAPSWKGSHNTTLQKLLGLVVWASFTKGIWAMGNLTGVNIVRLAATWNFSGGNEKLHQNRSISLFQRHLTTSTFSRTQMLPLAVTLSHQPDLPTHLHLQTFLPTNLPTIQFYNSDIN